MTSSTIHFATIKTETKVVIDIESNKSTSQQTEVKTKEPIYILYFLLAPSTVCTVEELYRYTHSYITESHCLAVLGC